MGGARYPITEPARASVQHYSLEFTRIGPLMSKLEAAGVAL